MISTNEIIGIWSSPLIKGLKQLDAYKGSIQAHKSKRLSFISSTEKFFIG